MLAEGYAVAVVMKQGEDEVEPGSPLIQVHHLQQTNMSLTFF